MTVLVVVEHDNQTLKGVTFNAVMAACQISMYFDGQIHVLAAGNQVRHVQEQAARINGVSKVIVADAPHLEHGLAENVAAQVLAIAGAYSHILFAATTAGKNVAPRVAAQLDVAQISDITRVVSSDTFECPIYGGNAIATVQRSDATKVITVRTTAFGAAACEGGFGHVERLSPVPPSTPKDTLTVPLHRPAQPRESVGSFTWRVSLRGLRGNAQCV